MIGLLLEDHASTEWVAVPLGYGGVETLWMQPCTTKTKNVST